MHILQLLTVFPRCEVGRSGVESRVAVARGSVRRVSFLSGTVLNLLGYIYLILVHLLCDVLVCLELKRVHLTFYL